MPSVVSCARCGSYKTLKYAPAFNRDGTATFRHLCARCNRIEWPLNQPSLPGLNAKTAPVYVETEPDPEPEPLMTMEEYWAHKEEEMQPGLFAWSELRECRNP